jgi:hypothetical protein
MNKKLIKGKDYHGWAWKNARTGKIGADDSCFMRHEPNGRGVRKVFPDGEWVRVKLIEVDARVGGGA